MARVRDEGAEAAAETVLRLAVLLQAGLAPVRAWSHLAETGDAAAARVVARHDEGMPLAEAVAQAGEAPTAGRAWREIAAAWRIAATVGAPLAASLRGVAAALRDAQEAADDVRIALAEPAGTARLLSWLPLVAIGLGLALGFDTLGVLFGSPLGITALVAGCALVVAARLWSAALVRRARNEAGIPGIGSELMAIALGGGVSLERARALVTASGMPVDAATESVLGLSSRAGVPAIELLRASAAHARHSARVAGRLRAARLSTRLLLPLGVCTLPAFLLLGVAPMMLGVMSTVPLSL